MPYATRQTRSGFGRTQAIVTSEQVEDLPFIAEDGIKKANAEARKVIRRHVMLGKNKMATRYTQNRRAKPATLAADLDISDFGTHIRLRQLNAPKLPSIIDSGLSFVQYADSVDLAMIADVIYFATFAKKALFPLEACTAFVHHRSNWLEPLVNDPALLHTMIFSTQDYFAQVQHGAVVVTNHASFTHSVEAIRLLRERLRSDDETSKVSDATLMVVLALAMHAHMLGEEHSATGHMLGLKKIIDIRGGIRTFKHNPKLLHEILRSDLNIALCYGKSPLFFVNNEEERHWPLPRFPNIILDRQMRSPADLMNDKLATLWHTMRAFANRIGHAIDNQGLLSVEILLDTFVSVMYRLLDMRFDLSCADEATRLGLLAFCARTFLQLRDIHLRYDCLQYSYRTCLTRMQNSTEISPSLKLWWFFVGATSLFTDTEWTWLLPALRRTLQHIGLATWLETRKLLTDFIWIGMIFDKSAQRIFDVCLADESLVINQENIGKL